jgi:hypothetical protein
MFVGLIDTRGDRPDRPEREPLVFDLPELRPWRWYVAAVVCFILADRLDGWAGLIPLFVGLGCAFYGLSTYTRGCDGMSKYRQ